MIERQTAGLRALTPACYDNQARGLGLDLPELYTPDDESMNEDTEPGAAGLVAQEGWIYFPKAAMAGRRTDVGHRRPERRGL